MIRTSLRVITGVVVASWWVEALAQTECNPRFTICPVTMDHSCTWQTNWDDSIDLDGDGVPDFHLVSVEGYMVCFIPPTAIPNGYYGESESLETFFPEARVQMYIQLHRGFVGPGSPLLTNQQAIYPDPSPGVGFVLYCAWNPPEALANTAQNGFGLLDRDVFDNTSHGGIPWHVGYLEGFLRQTNLAVIGFRLPKPDGWHLGWMRIEKLENPVTRVDGQQQHIGLVDSAVHPDPNTVIYTGERPRPKLEAKLTGSSVLVTWSTNWSGFILEQQSEVTKAPWTPVDGVTNNAARLDAANATLFLRLRRP